MSRGRHTTQPDPTRRRLGARLRRSLVATNAALVAVALVVAAVGLGAVRHFASGHHLTGQPAAASISGSRPVPSGVPEALTDRHVALSRSSDRTPLRGPAIKRQMWTTAPLKLRVEPQASTVSTGTVDGTTKIGLTGLRRGAYAQVVVDHAVRWVSADYLSATKPKPKPKAVAAGSKGLVDQPCPATAGVESGLQPGAVRVYRAVCNNFPQITTYGGYAPRGEHASGKAIDIMTSDSALGGQIAAFLQSHAAELNLYDIIWQQHIWTPVRASEGWRSMPDRGSETANHEDHVHVSTN